MNNPSGRNGNMRQNRRARGRSGGRKMPNPLTRSYESNGPDVKVRGTASNIAEKYQQLARDALASGDPIAAENYYQHAEHYLRIIATAQAQQTQQAEERASEAAEDRSDENRNDNRGEGRRNDRGRGRNGAGDGRDRSAGREREAAEGNGSDEVATQPETDGSADLASMPAFLRNSPAASPTTDADEQDTDDKKADQSEERDAVELTGNGAASPDEDVTAAEARPRRAPRRRAAPKPAADGEGAAEGGAPSDA